MKAAVPRDVRQSALQCAIRAYAASLLSASTEEMAKQATFIDYNNRTSDTPPHTHGDVERVARAMYDARCAGKKNYCDFDDLSTNGYHDTYEVFMADAAAALSAMRPVTVDERKLAEIKRRHDYCAHVATKTEWEGQHAWMAHDDRAFLLSVIEGVSHDPRTDAPAYC